jgi:5-methylthioadenosine/S-adenosylhomocysteine deaminase
MRFGVRDALRWATVNGAHTLGMEDRIGTLTPGKQADIVVIGGRRLNVSPMTDPVGCLVSQATAANVEHVLVAGRFVKRDGRLQRADLPRAIELACVSADRILRGIDLTPDQVSDGLTDFIDLFATRNLARAWTLA